MVLTPEIRSAMGEAAVKVAKSCQYSGAGTVEFLVDDRLNFYFLEMNTRLQVEHPVTEMITGVDLVRQQILVARGEHLAFRQEDLRIQGHALELRVYAEDPANNFLPSVGKLSVYQPPKGHGVRVDDGFTEGMDIPIFYDPMIAKLVTYGADRQEAIARMLRAIAEYRIVGVETTLPFGDFVLRHEAFLNGDFDTNFVKQYFEPAMLNKVEPEEEKIAAMLACFLQQHKPQNHLTANGKHADSRSKNNSNWKLRGR